MKLVSFKVEKGNRVGIILGDKILDLISAGKTYQNEVGSDSNVSASNDMIQFLNLGDEGISAAKRITAFIRRKLLLREISTSQAVGLLYDIKNIKLNAPVANPRKIVCLGLNYADHVKEAGKSQPREPILFSKPVTAIIGPEEPIVYPRISKQVDYEVELAVVIGKKGKDVQVEDAYDHVAGYTVFNDVSARDLQFHDGQWFRGKGFDTFAPMGPHLVLREDISDPNNLRLRTKVNGQTRQDGSTGSMIFKIPHLISFISQVMTLEPGDIIATGTPAGVGIFAKPEPKLLKPGDVVEVWIKKIGTLRNPVVRYR